MSGSRFLQPEPSRKKKKKKKVAKGKQESGAGGLFAWLPDLSAVSRFLHLDDAASSTYADMPNGDGLEEPPELVPTFMPTVRRVLSCFMCAKKQAQMKKRRCGGLRALLARMGFKSKFMGLPDAPKPTLKTDKKYRQITKFEGKI